MGHSVKRRDFLAGSSALALSLFTKKSEAMLRGSSYAKQWVVGQRPFAASSLVNTPLIANSILVPTKWDAPTGSNYYVAYKFFVDQPLASAPTVALTTTTDAWGNPAGVINRKMTVGFNNTGADVDLEAVSMSGNDCLSINSFTRQTDTTGICYVRASCDVVLDSGFGSGDPTPYGPQGAGVTATGCSCLIGALLKEEFAAGEILHMIAMCAIFDYSNGGNYPNFYAPAIGSDGSSGNGIGQEGQIWAIPQGTSMPSGLSAYGPKIFRAMQNYGSIMHDHGGATEFYLGFNYNNQAASWDNSDVPTYPAPGLITDANLLFPLLQKVGYPLDGLYNVMIFVEACAPQLQTLRYAGKLMNVTRDTGGALDIGNLGAPQGLLDTATIASFCSGTVGRVSTCYTQFGPYDFVSAGANAPIIYQSGAFKTINGLPALSFDGSTNYLKATGSSAQYPHSGGGGVNVFLNAVIQVPDRAANYTIFGPDAAGGLQLRLDATTGFVRLLKNGGATIAVIASAVALNTPASVSAHYNDDGSYSISINGVVIVSGSAALVSVTAANIQVGAGPSGAEPFKGLIGMWIFVAQTNIGDKIQFGIEQYQIKYWGCV